MNVESKIGDSKQAIFDGTNPQEIHLSDFEDKPDINRGGTGEIFLALNLIASEYIFFVLPSP